MVSKLITLTAELLEPAERDAVLGDIVERGPDPRALCDLARLVALRQAQDWQFWFPWSMTMLLPAFFIASFMQGISGLVSHLEFLDTRTARTVGAALLGTPILAWAIGFSLGSIGKRRAAIVLPLLAIFSGVFASTGTKFDPLAVAVTSGVSIVGAFLPALTGFVGGWRETRFGRHAIIALGVAAVASAAIVTPWVSNEDIRSAAILGPLGLWPIVYALRRAGTRPEIAHAN